MKLLTFCPVCGSNDLVAFNNRALARCGNCGAMERTRLLYEVMRRQGVLSPEMKVLHFAPEPGLAVRLRSLAKEYVPADIDVSQYTNFMPEAKKINLCDFDPKEIGQFDLIVHMHVLEHVPCSLDQVLGSLVRMLKPDASMYFSVPIRKNATTEEDISPKMTPEERTRRFGQHDHQRIFGDRDVLAVLMRSLGDNLTVIDPYALFSSREIKMMGINFDLKPLSGHSIFRYHHKVAAEAAVDESPAPKKKFGRR